MRDSVADLRAAAGAPAPGKLLPAVAWSCAGVAAGAALILTLSLNPALGLAFAVAIVLLPLIILRPTFGAAFGLLAMLLIEEFSAGLGDNDAGRASRTAFYATSIGVPGLYPPDLIMIVLICGYLLSLAIKRQRLHWPRDCVRYGLTAIAISFVVSVTTALMSGNVLDYGSQPKALSSIELVFNDRALRLIAFFQFKAFSCMFMSYVLGLLAIREAADVGKLLKVVGIAAAITVPIGLSRLIAHPEWVSQTIPVFLDTPSVCLFAVIGFYTIYGWSTGLFNRQQSFRMLLLSAILAVFILVSFRRTMWGGIALCFIPLFILLPSRARGRLALWGFLLLAAVTALVLATPSGQTLIAAVGSRAGETNEKDISTLVRVAIVRYIGEHWQDIPLLGYGPHPLWNEFVSLDYRNLRMDMENVHSLYAWLLLRTGYVGLLVTLSAQALMLRKAWGLARHARLIQYRAVAIVIFSVILLFLFSGLFNPIYAETRYTILWGIVLALLSRLAEFDKALPSRSLKAENAGDAQLAQGAVHPHLAITQIMGAS